MEACFVLSQLISFHHLWWNVGIDSISSVLFFFVKKRVGIGFVFYIRTTSSVSIMENELDTWLYSTLDMGKIQRDAGRAWVLLWNDFSLTAGDTLFRDFLFFARQRLVFV